MGDTDASGKDFLLDAVAQFLQSSEWLDAVSAFLESNFELFLTKDGAERVCAEQKVAEYSLVQYDSFTGFKDVVERLLEKLMADLGCSGEDLVAALEDSVRKEKSIAGERHFFIKTLLSFDDYDAFCDKMTQYAAEKQANGFTTCSGDVSVEFTEWKLQEVIARSILDAKALGQLNEAEEVWIPWAEAMVEMTKQAALAADGASSGVDESKQCESKGRTTDETQFLRDSEGVRELQQTLMRERLKVDLLVAQRIADGNASLKRQMLHLAEQQASQDQPTESSSEEDELSEQFKLVDDIRDRVKQVKAECFAFKDVQPEQMDKVYVMRQHSALKSYLFLKEKVHYKQDLVAQEKEIALFIFSHVEEKDAALIPFVLEWLLLESELQRTQNYIQELLNGPRDPGFWTQQWDEATQTVYYIYSVSGESVWEAPQCGYYDLNQEFQWEAAPIVEKQEDMESLLQETTSSESIDTSADPEMPTFDDVAQKLETAPLVTNGDAVEGLLEMESVLERISREHDEERKRLELVFELEKARQKEELRKRKEKKRREKLATKKKRDAARDAKDEAAGGQDTGNLSEEIPGPGLRGDAKLEDESQLQQPPAPVMSSRLMLNPDAKSERGDLSILVPGHGRVDLSHLLSDDHAKRHHIRTGASLEFQSANMTLHPTSLRYLTEQMIKRQEDAKDLPRTAIKEIVLEESADEK